MTTPPRCSFYVLDGIPSSRLTQPVYLPSPPQVGFFPSECVELINDKVPQSMTNTVPKPGIQLLLKHSMGMCWREVAITGMVALSGRDQLL